MSRARTALVPLGGFGAVAGLLLATILVWALVRSGTVTGIDAAILRDFRQAADPALTRAPRWLDRLFRDATVLGGGRILMLVMLGMIGLMVVRRAGWTALLLATAVASGSFVVTLVKQAVARVRPEIVPHLVDERSFSFPSAHAANSALVYLTIAALAVRLERHRGTRIYTMAVALLLTLLIGASRLYLGVHWPSDVLGGWCFGAGWSALWLMLAERWLPRPDHAPAAASA